MISRELPAWVQPDIAFTLDFGPDNDNTGRKLHVRAIVDGLAVVREWSKTKRRWEYSVEHPAYFHINREHIVPPSAWKVG